jgi:hypothetical protein
VKFSELNSKHVIAASNSWPAPPVARDEKRDAKANDNFELLDGTNPEKPYSYKTILASMLELYHRVERQSINYGGKIDQKTGKIDQSKHKFYDAQIAKDE